MIQPSTTTQATRLGDMPVSSSTPEAPATKIYGDFNSAETFELWIEAELAALELQFETFQTQRSLTGSLGR